MNIFSKRRRTCQKVGVKHNTIVETDDPVCQVSSKNNQRIMKLGSGFIIRKQFFQEYNKAVECLLILFSSNLDDSRSQNPSNKGSVYFLRCCMYINI